MRVVVRQTSGLGNQLFQYATGLWLAAREGASIHIAQEQEKRIVVHGHRRPCLLSKFSISAPLIPISALDRLVLSTKAALLVPSWLARTIGRVQIIREPTGLAALQSPSEFHIAANRAFVYLVGYWQSYVTVRDIESRLRTDLVPAAPLSAPSLQVAERIAAARHPVSVHIRRGDYLKVFGGDSLLPLSYYENALRYIQERYQNCSLFVFSDEPEFAASWLGSRSPAIIVDHNRADTANEDLILMSLCSAHIIANSTFSWWGAWLNNKPDKITVAPSSWLGLETMKTTLADPAWTLIDS